jgi:hypothetical protein
MANPYVNKVEVNGQAIIDLTGDTITPEALAQGVTAHNAAGAPIVGTMETGGGVATDIPAYNYTGSSVEEGTMGTDNYRVIWFKSNGDLTFEKDALLDVFMVGGGGAGGANMGGGGGGGYTMTRRSMGISAGTIMHITLGNGGAMTGGDSTSRAQSGHPTSVTYHGETISVDGGQGGDSGNGSANGRRGGGNGGSGGGGASYGTGRYKGGNGGEQGGSGYAGGYSSGNSAKRGSGGTGQGTITNAFGENDTPLFAGGGGGAGGGNSGMAGIGGDGGGGDGYNADGHAAEEGTDFYGGGGGGGGSGIAGRAGGKGVVIIRFARQMGDTGYPTSSGGDN